MKVPIGESLTDLEGPSWEDGEMRRMQRHNRASWAKMTNLSGWWAQPLKPYQAHGDVATEADEADSLSQPEWEDALDYLREREGKNGLSELMIPVVVLPHRWRHRDHLDQQHLERLWCVLRVSTDMANVSRAIAVRKKLYETKLVTPQPSQAYSLSAHRRVDTLCHAMPDTLVIIYCWI